MGCCGDHLLTMLSEVWKTSCQWEVLVLHLGESDLVDSQTVQLLSKIVEDIGHIWPLLPKSDF